MVLGRRRGAAACGAGMLQVAALPPAARPDRDEPGRKYLRRDGHSTAGWKYVAAV